MESLSNLREIAEIVESGDVYSIFIFFCLIPAIILFIIAIAPPVANAFASKIGFGNFSDKIDTPKRRVVILVGSLILFAIGIEFAVLFVPHPPVVTLIADKQDPFQVNDRVNWTAKAIDTNWNDAIVGYTFSISNNATGNRFSNIISEDDTCPMKLKSSYVGKNTIQVIAEDKGGLKSNKSIDFDVNPLNSKPEIDKIDPSGPSPKEAGASIRFDVRAHDTNGDPMLYKFRLAGPSTDNKWRDVDDWINAPSWTWKTNENCVGNNSIEVWVIDTFHSGLNAIDSNSIDDCEKIEYEILSIPPQSSKNNTLMNNTKGNATEGNIIGRNSTDTK